MTDVLAISLQGMQQDMARLERISTNLANATTTGYKRDVVSALPMNAVGFAATVEALQAGEGTAAALSTGSTAAGGLMIRSDLRPGTLKQTGASLDMALASAGYFEVGTPSGPAYTREGSWRLDPRGRLVTAQGHPVMGTGGDIVLTRPDPMVDAMGRIYEARAEGGHEPTPVAQLKVVQFERGTELRRIGDNLLGAADTPAEVPEAEVQVRQGYLENSNVSAMQEMVQLIQSMRHFESMQKLAQGYDEMVGAAVRKLGELS